MTIEEAIKKVLEDNGESLPAGDLATAAIPYLPDYSLNQIKSYIWRMVDERFLEWTVDRRIALSLESS